jgi:hypothetical protein
VRIATDADAIGKPRADLPTAERRTTAAPTREIARTLCTLFIMTTVAITRKRRGKAARSSVRDVETVATLSALSRNDGHVAF